MAINYLSKYLLYNRYHGVLASQFYFAKDTGGGSSSISFRILLAS